MSRCINREPRILCLNQMASSSFLQLIEHLAAKIGPVLLFTGSEVTRTENLQIRRAPRYSNRSVLSRLWTWGLYLLWVGFACLFISDRPLLFATSNPPFSPWLAWLLSRLKGWRYVVLIWDVYPDVLIRFGYLQKSSLVTRAWRYLDRLSLSEAELVVTIGHHMAETIRRGLGTTGVANLHIEVIPSWVDVDYIQPIPKEHNWFAQQHGQADKLTVLYSGNMGVTHDLDTVIQVAERMRHEPRIAFLLIGNGPQRAKLEQTVARKELSNVTILPLQPEEGLPYALTSGDIGIVSLDRGAEGISMPSKTYSMMAAGCAIVGLSHGCNDLADTIDNYACGVSVECGDADGLETALRRFLDQPELLSQCRNNARIAAETAFSAEECLGRYEQLFCSLMETSSSRLTAPAGSG